MNKQNKKIIRDFKYPILNEKNHQYGASLLQAPIINESGDWRNFVPPYEPQQRRGVEPSSCYVEAQQHTIASIHEKKLGELDNNWTARFNALLSGGTPTGGDPVAGADSIHDDGLIAEELMTYEGLNSWEDFHSWKGADEAKCRSAGKADLYLYDRRFGVCITRGLPVATKYKILREALKRSPVPMSVYGVQDGNTYIVKPEGVYDTHMVEALYCSPENKITILDTYEPFIKELPANYNMDFGMAWKVEKKSAFIPKKESWFARFAKGFLKVFTLKYVFND